PNVDIRLVDIAATADGRLYDSVVLVNVLEHIDDDANALEKLRASLRPGGRVCVFVPAFDGLYSDFDQRIGHRRRYRRSQLATVLDRAGQVPPQHWSVSTSDRLVVPTLRRLEAGRAPRFGQSLFCVGTVRD